MTGLTDQELLRDYAGRRSEAAFDELVRRHVDLVYSAARRMVRDNHLAEDVTQAVFVALAQNAPQLIDRPVLSGWLHRTAQNLAAKTVRTDVRRRAREQEAAVMNELLATGPDVPWEHIAPHLDAALGELNEPDRDALLLRYFERKSAREIAQTLGLSEDAAQKRVSRAVERLREFFARRGVTIGASGLVVVISANAVQAAPAGLAATISTAVALAGTTLVATATVTASKAIAMTTLQKTLVAAALLAAFGTGMYEVRESSRLRDQVQLLRQQRAPLVEQTQQLQRERDAASNRLAVALAENEELKSNRNAAELLRLRGDVASLREQLALLKAQAGSMALGSRFLSDPAMRAYFHQTQMNTARAELGSLFKELKLTPGQTEQVIALMGDLFMKNMDEMYSVAPGSLSSAGIAQATAEREAELNRQLQPLLGDHGIARLKEYRDEKPAQATIALVNGRLGANQLSDEQNNRLLQIVKTEPFDLTRGISGDWDPAFWGAPEDIDQHLQQVAESNRRVVEQAENFLKPEQLTALTAVLANAINERVAQAAVFIGKP